MANKDFYYNQKIAQIEWRKENISTTEKGVQNKKKYGHIIPKKLWTETLWSPIEKPLLTYLREKQVKPHTGTHNLLSSWVVAANLFFIVRIDDSFKKLMLGFLRKYASGKITELNETELEYAEDGENSPNTLLGESGGNRGSGQTSPDIAFLVRTASGKGLVLTECKFTEHSFYSCSARVKKDSKTRVGNPDPLRCMIPTKGYDHQEVCHQTLWGRKYWNLLRLSDKGINTFKRCPAATAGYQLFRQQALAEGMANSGKYDLVVSSVSFDGRNVGLRGSLRTTGVPDFTSEWGELYQGKALFKTWEHQDWVQYVRENGKTTLQRDWVQYLHDRYGY